MRLALLSPLPPEQTGIADYAEHWRQALVRTGVEIVAPLQGQPPIKSLAQARAWVAQQNWRDIDVVHAELGGGRFSEFLVMTALTELPLRPRLSATVHDPERIIWRPVSQFWSWLEGVSGVPRLIRQVLAVVVDPFTLAAERRLAQRLDGVVTLTQTGAACLARRMRLPLTRVSVISHGTLAIPHRAVPDLEPIRLLYFGFIYQGKGIEDLVDALGRVCAQYPELKSQVRLTIAGGTSPDIAYGAHGSYLDGLRARVHACGLDHQVEWSLDVAEHDIPDLIQRHHVMVLPYRESRKLTLLGQMRGTSGALAWAIACGRGVITSDARAFAEEIRHGNGASYPQGDVAALAKQLHGVLLNRDQVTIWAERARELAVQRDWSRTGQVFRTHFQSIRR